MTLPGFTADSSIYRTRLSYYTAMGSGALGVPADPMASGDITMAGSCTCTDPGCTWTCPPPPPDPCQRCNSLSGCARFKCFCKCAGGVLTPPNPWFPCGECT